MPDSEMRKARGERHTREVEDSQDLLRASIEKTRQLLDQSNAMLKRHRRECDDAGE
jgi:hypothetical protein